MLAPFVHRAVFKDRRTFLIHQIFIEWKRGLRTVTSIVERHSYVSNLALPRFDVSDFGDGVLVDRARQESVYITQAQIGVHVISWSPVPQKPTLSLEQMYDIGIESQRYGFTLRFLHAYDASGALFLLYCCVLIGMSLQHVLRQLRF